LFKKDRARFTTSRVHERLEVDGPVGRMQNDLLHYTDDSLYHYFSKFNRYTTLAAEDLTDQQYRFSLYDVVVRPPFSFFKMYVVRRGFLDRMPGLILCLASSAYVFCKYAKLWEAERGEHASRG
ncbi:MAG TPA: glycosyltransferase family 2 protein, partial [Bacteroidota bacterium]|nr:glycosyltransferase family 2 protein [Bacteroidota bacterium]